MQMQLHFSKRRRNESPDKIEVNLDLLCGLYTALAVTLKMCIRDRLPSVGA